MKRIASLRKSDRYILMILPGIVLGFLLLVFGLLPDLRHRDAVARELETLPASFALQEDRAALLAERAALRENLADRIRNGVESTENEAVSEVSRHAGTEQFQALRVLISEKGGVLLSSRKSKTPSVLAHLKPSAGAASGRMPVRRVFDCMIRARYDALCAIAEALAKRADDGILVESVSCSSAFRRGETHDWILTISLQD